MPNLLVVDQRLYGFEGHHYDFSRAIIEAALQAGCATFLACQKDFQFDELATAPVIARFSESTGISGRARRVLQNIPAPIRRRLLALAPRVKQARHHPNTRFAREFAAIAQTLNWTESDHILFHTLDENELLGLAEVLPQTLRIKSYLHLLLRYDGSPAATSAFSRLSGRNLRVHYWTDTEDLATHYRELGCPKIGVLPIPHGLGEIPERPAQANHPLTISYLGGARRDKGFHLLPDLVSSLAADYLTTGRARFLIQTTFEISRDEELVAATKRALSRFPREWVELIENEPDSATFRKHLHSSDLILLPYDSETYRRRSSGILVQALAAGIPSIVPQKTWLACEAPMGTHVAFSEDLPSAVRAALNNYEALSTKARGEMKIQQIRHGQTRIVEDLMSVDDSWQCN